MNLLDRNCPNHITASSIILNPSMDAMLMVYHNIYDSYSWTGGHADGEADLLKKAMEEAMEETGIRELWPMTSSALAVDLLPVKAHIKNGKPVDRHYHYNVAYGMIASDRQKLTVKPDENSDVKWIPLNGWQDVVKEPHMIPVYERIIQRMIALQQEKEELFRQIPRLTLPWFMKNRRELPWRKTGNPYEVWLSEIMLQQTRVEAVKGYYHRFLSAFPTVVDLANASEEQVMKLWEGLGYYSRARNLQKAAKVIRDQYQGVFPNTYEDILQLPGIGDYTAGAIASVCFCEPKAAVDGNILRVISRLTEDYRRIDDPGMKTQMIQKLERFYPTEAEFGDAARWYNQSLMEIGATVCVPNGAPKCEICPLAELCMAHKKHVELSLPRKKKKAERKTEEKTVFRLIREDGSMALQKRPENGLLAGLWQYPNVEGLLTPQDALQAVSDWGMHPLELVKQRKGKHIFSHVEWHMICYDILCEDIMEEVQEPKCNYGTGASDHEIVWKTQEEMKKEVALPSAFKVFDDAEEPEKRG